MSNTTKFDEADLVAFFGVLPVEQEPSEKEFYGSIGFEYKQDNLSLEISISQNFRDFFLDLKLSSLESPILHIHIENVASVEIHRDKVESIPTLRVFEQASRDRALIEVRLKPSIRVETSNLG